MKAPKHFWVVLFRRSRDGQWTLKSGPFGACAFRTRVWASRNARTGLAGHIRTRIVKVGIYGTELFDIMEMPAKATGESDG